MFTLNLGGKVTLNWFSIVMTGIDLSPAPMTVESLESETTSLGSNLAMLSVSKAICLRNELNIDGKVRDEVLGGEAAILGPFHVEGWALEDVP